MFIAQLLTIVGQLALTIARPTLDVRDGATAVVHLDQNTGNPQHLGSGILYGVPDAANQIPDNFYTQIGFNYLRAGGAQTLAPGRGWIWGRNEYKVSLLCDPSLTTGSIRLCPVKLQDSS